MLVFPRPRAIHPTREAIAEYVYGGASPERAAVVEAHVTACERCAADLQREAIIQEALYAVAEELAAPAPIVASPARRKSFHRRWSAPLASGIAAAAVVALLILADGTRAETAKRGPWASAIWRAKRSVSMEGRRVNRRRHDGRSGEHRGGASVV